MIMMTMIEHGGKLEDLYYLDIYTRIYDDYMPYDYGSFAYSNAFIPNA